MAAARREGKIGRNEACPCGSGRKYKRCCLLADRQESSGVVLWRRLATAYASLAERLDRYAERSLHPDLVREATDAFYIWNARWRQLAPDVLDPVLDDWIVHGFVADPLEPRPDDVEVPEGTVAERHLDQMGARLPELEHRLLRAGCARGYSLLAVRALDRASLRLELHDLLTGETLSVLHGEPMDDVPVGAVLFARVATLDGTPHLAALSPLALRPPDQLRILDWRDALGGEGVAIPAASLREVGVEIRELYLELLLEPPAAPEEPAVEPLRFALGCSAEDVVVELGAGPQDLASAVHDEATGELRHAVLAVHDPFEATLELDGVRGLLLARPLDPARLDELRETIEKTWLPGQVMLLGRGLDETGPASETRGDEEPGAAGASHAVRVPSSWPEWIHAPHPALHGQAPREAATTAAGRERLHAWLAALRFEAGADPDPSLDADLGWVRRELGLA